MSQRNLIHRVVIREDGVIGQVVYGQRQTVNRYVQLGTQTVQLEIYILDTQVQQVEALNHTVHVL